MLLWEKEESQGESILNFGKNISNLISEVRKYKSERNLSLKESIESIKIIFTSENKKLFEDIIMDIKACTSAKDIDITEGESFKIEITRKYNGK